MDDLILFSQVVVLFPEQEGKTLGVNAVYPLTRRFLIILMGRYLEPGIFS